MRVFPWFPYFSLEKNHGDFPTLSSEAERQELQEDGLHLFETARLTRCRVPAFGKGLNNSLKKQKQVYTYVYIYIYIHMHAYAYANHIISNHNETKLKTKL